MNYYKINNFQKENGLCDYKGIDIKLNVPYSQIHDIKNNIYYLINTDEKMVVHEDIEILTEEQYNQIKLEFENKPKPKSEMELLQEQINAINIALAETLGK